MIAVYRSGGCVAEWWESSVGVGEWEEVLRGLLTWKDSARW